MVKQNASALAPDMLTALLEIKALSEEAIG